jgi:hypothetical protein
MPNPCERLVISHGRSFEKGGRDTEGDDLFTAHAAELGQERDQGAGQYRCDPRHGNEESVSVYERGIGSHDLDQVCVQHIDISCKPADTTTRKPQQDCVFQHRGGILGGNLLIAELAANSQHLIKSLRCARRVGMIAIKDATHVRGAVGTWKDLTDNVNLLAAKPRPPGPCDRGLAGARCTRSPQLGDGAGPRRRGCVLWTKAPRPRTRVKAPRAKVPTTKLGMMLPT